MVEDTKSLIEEMYTEEARIKTFKHWPFDEKAKCSGVKMAEAGFFHCPTENEPDLVQCYVCYKELDGWQADDSPWDEHYSHSKICVFAKIGKPQRNLTIAEIFQIETERKVNKHKRLTAQAIKQFRIECEKVEELAMEAFEDISKEGKPKTKSGKKK